MSEELTKKHAEELRAQEERLVAKHREELEKAIEVATAKARESAPAPASVPTAEDQKAAIDAAVAAALAAKDAELRTKHQTDIEKAVESSRLEGTMKLRLKDTSRASQQHHLLPCTQRRLREPSPTTSAPARGGTPLLPMRKPSAPGATASQPARGRGRGVVRGGGSIGIHGAAAKRTCEEGEVATEDSLAKRLKPTVAAAAATTTPTADGNANAGGATGGKPITLQRNRVQPS